MLSPFGQIITDDKIVLLEPRTVQDIMDSEEKLTNAYRNKLIEQFKQKANFPVRDSAILLGVCDPTGTLEHDQIFLQIKRDSFSRDLYYNSKENGVFDLFDEIGKSELITGKVIVGRSPCVMPSEIRTLNAVDARAYLGHLVNVVVFSSMPNRH